jgi:hypothetical protein
VGSIRFSALKGVVTQGDQRLDRSAIIGVAGTVAAGRRGHGCSGIITSLRRMNHGVHGGL